MGGMGSEFPGSLHVEDEPTGVMARGGDARRGGAIDRALRAGRPRAGSQPVKEVARRAV